MEGSEGHAVLVQVPSTVHAALLQVAERVPAYPVLQTGAQTVPPGDGATQSPAAELEIGGSEAQAVLVHIPVVVHTALLQVAERVPVNPELQLGVQVVPLAVPTRQLPAPALEMEGNEEQLVLVHVPV